MPLPRNLTLQSLRLVDFRNYLSVSLDLAPGLTLLTGPNGQGKSNLLEAIATLTLTKSPRAQLVSELVRDGANAAAVDGTIHRANIETLLSLRLYRTDLTRTRRVSSVDGKMRPASEIIGLVPTVLFWPDHLAIVKDGQQPRRRFLDVLLAQLSSRSAKDLINYQKLLEQRNALLKQLRLGMGDLQELDAFTLRISEVGASIQVARASLVLALSPLAQTALADLTNQTDQLTLTYLPKGQFSPPTDIATATANLLAAFDQARAEELSRALTLVGPHRDQLDILLDSRPVHSHASQGQQRTILLALKLAELRHLAFQTDYSPLLLLDDVLSELDSSRRAAFLHLATTGLGTQTIITSADPLELLETHQIARLTVKNGEISQAPSPTAN